LTQPFRGRFEYDRAELWADGVIHALGISLGLAGAAALVAVFAPASSPSDLVPVIVYSIGLLAVLTISAAYNMWPISPVKWWLRRCDHSAIFVLIAGTYTPFLVRMSDSPAAQVLIVLVWAASIAGIVLKVTVPGRFDRLSIGLYLAIGWSGVVLWERILLLPSATLWLLAGGALFYTGGIVFHLWDRLRFHNAIWHACVLVATIFHYGAVVSLITTPAVAAA
jgi:hemolysin III